MNPTNFRKSLWKSTFYLLALLVPPLLIGAGTAAVRFQAMAVSQAPAFTQPLPPPPAHDASKRTAVIIAGNLGTENTDFLAPYAVLAASRAFNLYVVAPERRLSSLSSMPALSESVDIVPDFSFAEYEQVIGHDPDLIVVPYIPNLDTPQDRPLIDWIRHHAGPTTTLLSICAGARTLAETGLLDGYTATSHHGVLPGLKEEFTGVQWMDGVRYVDDGRIITSAGITAGIDATLHAVRKLVDLETAKAVARELHYPHARFLDDEIYQLSPTNMAVTAVNFAYVWKKDKIGFYLYDGVDELAIAAIVDSYPFTGAAHTLSFAPERKLIRTRHGLHLVPRWTFADAPAFDRILLPGGDLAADAAQAVEQWAQRRKLTVEAIHSTPDQFVFDLTLPDVAQRYSRPITEVVVNGLEYPFAYDQLGGSRWPFYALVTPILLGIASLGLFIGWQRRKVIIYR